MGEVKEYFLQETKIESLKKLQGFSNRAKILVYKINEYEKAQNIQDINSWVYEKKVSSLLKEEVKNQFNDIVSQGENLYDKLVETRQNLYEQAAINNIENVLMESYKLINEIGESLTGEKIDYSITLPNNGTKISFEMSLEQFCKNAITISYGSGINLKTGKSFVTSLLKNKDITSYDWNQNKNKFYSAVNWQKFLYAIRIAIKGKANDIQFNNEGTKLESYFHWVDSGESEYAKVRHLYGGAFNHMVKNLQKAIKEGHNNDPYWTKGDIKMKNKQMQIKGEGASVTSTASLKAQLLRFVMITNYLNFDHLINRIDQTKGKVTSEVKDIMEKHLEILTNQFLRTNTTWITINDLKELMTINDLNKLMDDII